MIQAQIQDKTLAGLEGVQHRFFTRRGGVSAGLYSSLNCGYGSGDSPDKVRTVGTERWTSPGAPKADALVTDRPGVVLGVMAADCAPVLLADAEAQVVGAAHAGWRGALGGIVEATVSAMERLGARRDQLHAAIGPCIGRESYEV